MQPQGPEGPQPERYAYPEQSPGVAGAGHARAAEPKAGGGANTRLWVTVGAVVVVVAALAVAGFFLFGGTKSAKDTVSDYVTALQKGDSAAAYATFSTSSKASQTEKQFADTLKSVLAQSGGIKSVTVEKVTEADSSATAQYRVVTGLGEETWQVGLVKEGDKWAVDANQLRQISNTYAPPGN